MTFSLHIKIKPLIGKPINQWSLFKDQKGSIKLNLTIEKKVLQIF